MVDKRPSIEQYKERFSKIEEKVAEAARKAGKSRDDIKIIAVSKTHPAEYIIDAMKAGLSVFGENYAQEMRDKHAYFEEHGLQHPEWHFIGHLQRNKVKYVTPFIRMIHAVDSVRLARKIDSEAEKCERKIDILLQVNTSGEESKFGCDPKEIFNLAEEVLKFDNTNIKGLMTIGSFTNDGITNKREFELLRKLKDEVNTKFSLELKELSMGMTNDYELAVEEGATIVRIGTAIFGERDYSG